MPEGDTLPRAASALRTALVGKPMVAFHAPRLEGPVPRAGRLVERVESHGRHLEVEWDDGLVLHTHVRRNGSWHLYRPAERWRRPDRDLTAAIVIQEWIAVCFNALLVETYRELDRGRHPGAGRLGPDLCRDDADLSEVVNLVLSYPDPEARLRDVLLDQHVMRGIGNVYRCEVLWATRLSPWAHVGDLGPHDALLLVETAARVLRSNLDPTQRISNPVLPDGLAVYGRNGQGCPRCHETIAVRTVAGRTRLLYWCPGCQVRLDRRHVDTTPAMDPHPAAAKFLAELPWRRSAG